MPKCANDRSLAIAHGPEDVFWGQGADVKWQQRDVDEADIEALIAERTSPAVEDALRSLLDAPTAGNNNCAPRRRARAARRRAGAEA